MKTRVFLEPHPYAIYSINYCHVWIGNKHFSCATAAMGEWIKHKRGSPVTSTLRKGIYIELAPISARYILQKYPIPKAWKK